MCSNFCSGLFTSNKIFLSFFFLSQPWTPYSAAPPVITCSKVTVAEQYIDTVLVFVTSFLPVDMAGYQNNLLNNRPNKIQSCNEFWNCYQTNQVKHVIYWKSVHFTLRQVPKDYENNKRIMPKNRYKDATKPEIFYQTNMVKAYLEQKLLISHLVKL